MSRGKNIIIRKKISEAIEQIKGTFTATDISDMTGISPRRIGAILIRMNNVEKVPTKRTMKLRNIYRKKGE